MGWTGCYFLGFTRCSLRSHQGYFPDAMKILLIIVIMSLSVSSQKAWDKPGCHRLGYARDIYIPGCVKFRVWTNACRGFCTSYSFPSPQATLENNPNHIITSRAECCSMTQTHDVHVKVRCIEGYRNLTFKSALTCSCSVCHNNL